MSVKKLLVALALIASHAAVFFASPRVHQLFRVMSVANASYADANMVQQDDEAVLSEKERYLNVIVAIPAHLAQESENDRREWSQSFLALQPNVTWVCVKEGEFLGYAGFAFNLCPSEKNVAYGK